MNLRFATLTLQEKRATVHKLKMIENQLPLYTRQQIRVLLNEIYECEQSERISDSSRACGPHKVCCIS